MTTHPRRFKMSTSATSIIPTPQPTHVPITFSNTTKFQISERFTAPDSFTVQQLPSKTDALVIKGKLVDFYGRKMIKDLNENALLYTSQNVTAVLQQTFFYNEEKKPVFMMRKKGFIRGRGTLYLWKGDSDKGDPFLEIKARNIVKSEFEIKEFESGQVWAFIKRNLGGRRLVTGLDTYQVVLNPGFDLVLVSAIVASIDEQYTEGNA